MMDELAAARRRIAELETALEVLGGLSADAIAWMDRCRFAEKAAHDFSDKLAAAQRTILEAHSNLRESFRENQQLRTKLATYESANQDLNMAQRARGREKDYLEAFAYVPREPRDDAQILSQHYLKANEKRSRKAARKAQIRNRR